MADFGAFAFYAHTVPGLEPIAWREIQAHCPRARWLGFRRVRDQNGIVLFEYPGAVADLLQLRSTEDIFYLAVHEDRLPQDRTGLRAIAGAIRGSRYLDVGLRLHRQVKGGQARGRTTFRVIARA